MVGACIWRHYLSSQWERSIDQMRGGAKLKNLYKLWPTGTPRESGGGEGYGSIDKAPRPHCDQAGSLAMQAPSKHRRDTEASPCRSHWPPWSTHSSSAFMAIPAPGPRSDQDAWTTNQTRILKAICSILTSFSQPHLHSPTLSALLLVLLLYKINDEA